MNAPTITYTATEHGNLRFLARTIGRQIGRDRSLAADALAVLEQTLSQREHEVRLAGQEATRRAAATSLQ